MTQNKPFNKLILTMENAAIADKPPLLITELDNYEWISTCLKQGRIMRLKWSLSPERLAAVD